MASVVAEIKWLIGLYKELGIVVETPIHLYCDSKTAIQIAANPIFQERTSTSMLTVTLSGNKLYRVLSILIMFPQKNN